jgi:hypothetical protein
MDERHWQSTLAQLLPVERSVDVLSHFSSPLHVPNALSGCPMASEISARQDFDGPSLVGFSILQLIW